MERQRQIVRASRVLCARPIITKKEAGKFDIITSSSTGAQVLLYSVVPFVPYNGSGWVALQTLIASQRCHE